MVNLNNLPSIIADEIDNVTLEQFLENKKCFERCVKDNLKKYFHCLSVEFIRKVNGKIKITDLSQTTGVIIGELFEYSFDSGCSCFIQGMACKKYKKLQNDVYNNEEPGAYFYDGKKYSITGERFPICNHFYLCIGKNENTGKNAYLVFKTKNEMLVFANDMEIPISEYEIVNRISDATPLPIIKSIKDKIFLVDDNDAKRNSLKASLEVLFPEAEIVTHTTVNDFLYCFCRMYRQDIMREPESYLVVTDMQMPIADEGEIDGNGGMYILQELRRLKFSVDAMVVSSKTLDLKNLQNLYEHTIAAVGYDSSFYMEGILEKAIFKSSKI